MKAGEPAERKLKMKEYLYSVGLEDKRTKEKFNLRVWARNVDDATYKITGALFGADGEYRWTGTGPERDENGDLISRECVKERM